MTKKAKSKRVSILKGINKFAVGFTIIETMLFLAIAGLIFAGIVASTNGAIRQQRYKDAVQSFVDDLRDLYSLAENTQVLDYGQDAIKCGGVSDAKEEGRGRSDCSVYGIFAIISPSSTGEKNIEARWVIGKDQSLVETRNSDLEFMSVAKVSTIFTRVTGGGEESATITAKSRDILWGADVSLVCGSLPNDYGTKPEDCNNGKKLADDKYAVFLLIYRSPITGAINTLTGVFERPVSDKVLLKHFSSAMRIEEYEKNMGVINNYHTYTAGQLGHSDISLCVTTGAGMGSKNGLRMITIDGKGSNTNAVRLIEADSNENKCN